MSGIKFIQLTKEIELKGSESFIESNFDKIQKLLIESFGMKIKKVSRRRKAQQETMTALKAKEARTRATMMRQEPFITSQSPSTVMTSKPHISHEIEVNRPPVRKYIRKVGLPGQERIMVETIEQKPKELSLAQLKEKFGLSDSKNGGINWDSKKHEKTRISMNGRY